jgi:hypothetical protein
MDKIKEQANVVSQLVFSNETGDIYKKTLTRSWDIIRETGLLFWLVICLTFVGGEWFYRNSVQLGRNARTWYTNLSEKGVATDEAQSMGTTGQALLDTVQSGTTYLLSQARKQLGIKEPEPMSTPTTSVASASMPPIVEPPQSTVHPTHPAEITPATDSTDLDETL